MKENKTKIIVGILVIVLVVIACIGAQIFLNKPLGDAQTDLQKDYEKYGYVNEETADTLIANFNKQIFDNSGLGPVSDDYVTMGSNSYWYEITEGIYLIVNTDTNQSDKKDIVDSMLIYFEKDSKDDPQVNAYTKLLIMANNEEITNDEAQGLIDEALNLASQKLTSNNGKGISVGYLEEEDHYEYQVIRLYK